MEELEQFKKENTDKYICAFKGIVFKFGGEGPKAYLDPINGKDATCWLANRWANANKENTKSPASFEEVQKEYLNGEIQKMLKNGEEKKSILGKLDSEKYEWGFDDYDW